MTKPEIYTGMLQKSYEVWATPRGNKTWADTNSRESRKLVTTSNRDYARGFKDGAASYTRVAVEMKEVYKPVEEIPVLPVKEEVIG